ncbi:gamma-glutamyl hydrolase-like [Xylocopa sonorina]|uniref:gamma-glutamyl hydrolase-like n=1 Tax=Xylocopa sonorina TaxID=1818115 RepID=UPI00403B223D
MFVQPVTVVIFAFFVLHCLTISKQFDTQPNNRPIIGILTQEISASLKKQVYPEIYDSYIAASYVKFIEGAGARVVPIWIGKNEFYYRNILNKINGVLWPGGGASFSRSNGYADAGYAIYKIAKQMNEDGHYFPILGICLGFELLTYVVANRVETRTKCNSMNQTIALNFTADYLDSRLYKDALFDIADILETKKVTANYHRFCVTKNNLKRIVKSNKFRILSLNNDWNGIEFISSLEHVTLPFYGLQFHPEKNLYEWVRNKYIPHGANAIKIAQYFANFFVSEARKSKHKFSSEEEELENLIYNYKVKYTGLKNSNFMQCYMFKNTVSRNMRMVERD